MPCFEDYLRIPGTGSITLPDESAPQNDAIGLDGVVSATGFAGVGQIVVPLPHTGQHPTHRFCAERRRDKKPVTIAVYRKADSLGSIIAALAAAGCCCTYSR